MNTMLTSMTQPAGSALRFADAARRIVGLVLCALTLTTLSLASSAQDRAAKADPPLGNDYTPHVGEAFFLLSDAAYGTTDEARVRVELHRPDELHATGGLDIAVYRVPQPLEFLAKQRNLHRIDVAAAPADEGLSNTLTHLWDNWSVKARLAWRQMFSKEARATVTAQTPSLESRQGMSRDSSFEQPRRFKPLPGFATVASFRYPVHAAKPIAPPADLRLAGSSSEFINPSAGNVYVPLGKLAAGLYLVEAMAGEHRAHTLLFVSDTMVVTKVSGEQMLLWSTRRDNGRGVADAQMAWSDGVGTLQSGRSDAQGLLRLSKKSPEASYVYGVDAAGGVFIAENFYYDSEIYNTKLYAVTDRPLYRPGDTVRVKVTGRDFKNARDSVALADGTLALVVHDPSGQAMSRHSMPFSGRSGANGEFMLPDNAPAGGWELMMELRGERYAAAFRVADYQKPHFEALWLPDKPGFATHEAVKGRIQLSYPDGKPVANASIALTARAQKLHMIDGELDFTGAFAVKVTQDELRTDASGVAAFDLPPATEPLRYTLTALATDGAAYRVRTSTEMLIERASSSYKLMAATQFSTPKQSVAFTFAPSDKRTAAATAVASTWEWLRLEDRSSNHGKLDAQAAALALAFPLPGSYTVTLRDADRRIVAATSHHVSGDGLKAPAGSIGIVFDRARYKAGDTATALVTFPDATDDALLTLERDRVEAAALMSRGGEGLRAEKINATQWRVQLAVKASMSPNVTLSVARVKDGDLVFQNQGLLVEQPRIALSFEADKDVYAPGDTVTVELETTVAGQGVPADVSVGVVDEMIYVLQPEIAPGIDDFFYHPRRNNVRTSASTAFIGYDLATSKLGKSPKRRDVNERGVKLLERPRRDDVDTAAWLPTLRTDANGRTTFSFKMPDSLTRWRITARAIDAQGRVGQQTSWVRSHRDFYLKWAAPNWQREGDRAQAVIAVFNQTGKTQKVLWTANGDGIDQRAALEAKPGANFVALPVTAGGAGRAALALKLEHEGRTVDALDVTLRRTPAAWLMTRELPIEIDNGRATLDLPADASQLRVWLAPDAASLAFSRWTDALVDHPYGCVEQTASRIVPLALALQSLGPAQISLAPMLTQRLAGARLSLIQMAGPNATFGWWGRGMATDPFLTAYAYFADWRAMQAMKTSLPASHWQHVLEIYRSADGHRLPPLQRALALHWMREMGLPVASMQQALVDELRGRAPQANAVSARTATAIADGNSMLMAEHGAPHAQDTALVLAVHSLGAKAQAGDQALARSAAARLASQPSPFVQALLLVAQPGVAGDLGKARALLPKLMADAAGIDRAQALVWLHQTLTARSSIDAPAPVPSEPWVAQRRDGGSPSWQWPAGRAVPSSIELQGDAASAQGLVSWVTRDDGQTTMQASVKRTLYRVVQQPRRAATPEQATAASGAAPGAATGTAAGATAGATAGAVPAPSGRDRIRITLERVAPGTPLSSNELYLDELELATNEPLRWALLEAALPPGASVESTTWGLDLVGTDGQSRALERAQHQATAQGYAVPVDVMDAGGRVTVRHLLRFAQQGNFKLPPARAWRMYAPESRAIEAVAVWASMEVK